MPDNNSTAPSGAPTINDFSTLGKAPAKPVTDAAAIDPQEFQAPGGGIVHMFDQIASHMAGLAPQMLMQQMQSDQTKLSKEIQDRELTPHGRQINDALFTTPEGKKQFKKVGIDPSMMGAVHEKLIWARGAASGMQALGKTLSNNPDLSQSGIAGKFIGQAMQTGETGILGVAEGAIKTLTPLATAQTKEGGLNKRAGAKNESLEKMDKFNNDTKVAVQAMRDGTAVSVAKINQSMKGAKADQAKLTALTRGFEGAMSKGKTLLGNTMKGIQANLNPNATGGLPPEALASKADQANITALSEPLSMEKGTINGGDPAEGAKTLMGRMMGSINYYDPETNKIMTAAAAKSEASKAPSGPFAQAYLKYMHHLQDQIVQQAMPNIQQAQQMLQSTNASPVFINVGGDGSEESSTPAGAEQDERDSDNPSQ